MSGAKFAAQPHRSQLYEYGLLALDEVIALGQVRGNRVGEVEISILVELVGAEPGPIAQRAGQVGRAKQIIILLGDPARAGERKTTAGKGDRPDEGMGVHDHG